MRQPWERDDGLSLKLPQMMVEVRVHQLGPFRWSQRPEEGVGMCGTEGRPARDESVDQLSQPTALHRQIPVIEYDQAGIRRGVAAHWPSALDDRTLCPSSQKPTNQDSRWTELPCCHLHCGGAMRYGLRGGHLAPLAHAIRSQLRDPLLNFRDRRGFKEILHAVTSPSLNFRCPLSRARCMASRCVGLVDGSTPSPGTLRGNSTVSLAKSDTSWSPA